MMPRRKLVVLACFACGSRACAALIVAAVLLLAAPTYAQTYTVIHNFTGGADGGNPIAGVTIGTGGNLNGTTLIGGYYDIHS